MSFPQPSQPRTNPSSRSTSPRRQPLHRRTDSQVNELASSPYLSPLPTDDDVYSKNPFPQFPSQILPPSGNIYVFEDDSAVPSSREATPQSTKRQGRTGRGNGIASNAAKGKGKARANVLRANQPLGGLSTSSRADSTGSHSQHSSQPSSGSRDLKKKKSRSRSRPRSIVEVYQDDVGPPPTEPLPPLPLNVDTHYLPPLSPTPLDNLLGRDPPEQTSATSSGAQFDFHQDAGRLRSQSSAVSSWRDWLATDYDSSARPSEERPRSRSSPIAPTEAFLEALMDDSVDVQYPQLRQPSATSLRTESSSVKAAYPPPLKLQRKRAHAQLSYTAAMHSQQAAESRSAASGKQKLALPSYGGDLYDIESAGMASSFSGSNRLSETRISGRWTDEMDDTITDLNPPPLWHQKSNFTLRSSVDSRHTSTSSLSMSGTGLYGILNDSRTAWAPIYYRGSDNKLQLDSAPNLTAIHPLPDPQLDPRTPGGSQRSRGTTQTSVTGPSQSPPSAGFPDSIYIPRARPFQHAKSESSPSVIVSEFENPRPQPPIPDAEPEARPRSLSEPLAPQAHSPQFVSRPVWSYAFDPKYGFDRLAPSPHLSRDKREFFDAGPRQWSAPSFDEDQSLLSRTNRQIMLFCIGYVCPLAWILAAFLPIPPRPAWRRTTPVDQIEKATGRGEVDLFDSMDVSRHRRARWWRNLNRFMSVAGACIIITIIILTVIATT